MLSPRSCKVSLRISPGWTGGSLAVVLRDFGIFGVSFVKGEANAVLVVDPDAVLPFAIVAQSFQAVARRDDEISDCLRGVQSGQTAQGDRSHIGELFDALPLEKGFGLLVSEAPDHNMEGIACYVVRQAYRRTGYRGTAASLC